jgi:Ca2+-binding RTX toxin-like protein
MDLNDIETIDFNALGGADTVVVNDLAGTNAKVINVNLASSSEGGGDESVDVVSVNGTAGDDVIFAAGNASAIQVTGLAAVVNVANLEPGLDKVVLNALGGDDVIFAGGVSGFGTTQEGGTGNDILIGGSGNDSLFGNDNDDVLLGGPGLDLLDGGAGSNVLIQD